MSESLYRNPQPLASRASSYGKGMPTIRRQKRMRHRNREHPAVTTGPLKMETKPTNGKHKLGRAQNAEHVRQARQEDACRGKITNDSQIKK